MNALSEGQPPATLLVGGQALRSQVSWLSQNFPDSVRLWKAWLVLMLTCNSIGDPAVIIGKCRILGANVGGLITDNAVPFHKCFAAWLGCSLLGQSFNNWTCHFR